MLVNMSSATLEEYYPAIAIATLMRIIRDPTLSQHHTMVVQVGSFIILIFTEKKKKIRKMFGQNFKIFYFNITENCEIFP